MKEETNILISYGRSTPRCVCFAAESFDFYFGINTAKISMHYIVKARILITSNLHSEDFSKVTLLNFKFLSPHY